MSLRSPLARVLYLGAARDGVGHWWVQRVTAIALAPLAIWLTAELLALPDGYDAAIAWIGAGVHPVLLALALVLAIWHSWLGVQVVIEDYVHGFLAKTCSLLLSSCVHGLLVASALYAVLRIALRGTT